MTEIQDTPILEESKVANQVYNWKYILNIASEHKREIIYANIIAILATLASVPLPLLMPLLVDEVLLNKPAIVVATINTNTPDAWHGPTLYISVILILTLCLRLTALVLNVWQSRQFTIIAKDVIFRIRYYLLSHLQKVSMSEYETLGSGTVASYLVTDLQTIDEFVGSTVSRLLVAVLTVIGVAVILLWIHWQLALLILFVNPVVIYFTMVLGKHVKELKKQENSAFAIFQQSLVETLDSIHQIRASNRERHYIMQIIDQAKAVKEHGTAYAWKSDAANRLSFMIFLFGFDFFRAVAMLMVVFSGLSIGLMFAVFGYLWFMMGPVQEILNIQYASGGGKSTLVQVLIGLYSARTGMIYYDGVPVSDIGLDVIRENVATVLQHPALFNDSIRTNLTMGRELDNDRLWHALEIAQLKGTVEEMQNGLDTIVGRQGIRLSGGQRQRLAIARMVLSEPKVVILDEATSALDAETEYQLHAALSDFLKDRTTLIVAHRLSAIKQASHVYVFEAGVISEQGSHRELLSQDGLYSKLYGVRQSMN